MGFLTCAVALIGHGIADVDRSFEAVLSCLAVSRLFLGT